MAADLVLLADDPVTVPADRIGGIAVLATVVDGQVSHDLAGLLAAAGLPELPRQWDTGAAAHAG